MYPPLKGRHSHGCGGFSLTESLAVIAVIAILASLVYTKLEQVKGASMQVKCVSRMRQCANLILLYAQDNQGRLPAPDNAAGQRWIHLVSPYLGKDYEYAIDPNTGKNVKKSGSGDLYREEIFHDPLHQPETGAGVFGYNENLNFSSSGAIPMARISSPSKFPILGTKDAEEGGGIQMSTGGPSSRALKYGYSGTIDPKGPTPLFGKLAVFAFADGHAAAIDVCNRDAWPWNDPDAFKVK